MSDTASAYERAYRDRELHIRDEARELRRVVLAFLLSSPGDSITVTDTTSALVAGPVTDFFVTRERDEANLTTTWRLTRGTR